jgi:hypothetical protein
MFGDYGVVEQGQEKEMIERLRRATREAICFLTGTAGRDSEAARRNPSTGDSDSRRSRGTNGDEVGHGACLRGEFP